MRPGRVSVVLPKVSHKHCRGCLRCITAMKTCFGCLPEPKANPRLNPGGSQVSSEPQNGCMAVSERCSPSVPAESEANTARQAQAERRQELFSRFRRGLSDLLDRGAQHA